MYTKYACRLNGSGILTCLKPMQAGQTQTRIYLNDL
jgi:hypothetical protein